MPKVELLTGNIDGAEVNISDIQGKIIKNFEIPARKQQTVCSLKGLAPGIYLVQISRSDRLLGAEKIMVK